MDEDGMTTRRKDIGMEVGKMSGWMDGWKDNKTSRKKKEPRTDTTWDGGSTTRGWVGAGCSACSQLQLCVILGGTAQHPFLPLPVSPLLHTRRVATQKGLNNTHPLKLFVHAASLDFGQRNQRNTAFN